MAERTSSIIERRPVVSHKNFFRQYEAGLGTPVVFTDVVKQWPAYDKWSFEWLKESYGSTNVTIVTGKMDYDVTFQKCEMSLAQYVDALVDRNGSDRFYLSNYDLGSAIPSLCNDFSFPRFRLHRWLTQYHYWIGPAGTRTQLHCDSAHNFFAQIVGRKQFNLYSPKHSDDLCPMRTTWYSSFSAADYESGRAIPSEPLVPPDFVVQLEPGELLFLPYGWWHRVTSLTPSISVNQFWITLAMLFRVALRLPPRSRPDSPFWKSV